MTGPLDRPQPSLAIAGDRKVAVLSINVNGFNAACVKGLLEYLTQQYDSHDVLLLQEVKLAPAKQAAARDSLLRIGYTYVAINSIAGIAVRSTLVNPMFTCDIPGCDLPDARRRIMTMTTSDPPVTVVCAYLPFCNPLTDDIDPAAPRFVHILPST
jgi:exonuclease III